MMRSQIDESAGLRPKSTDCASEVARRIGTVIAGSYRLLKHIGSGSSSHVFSAEHLRLGMPVAVKVLRCEVAASDRAAVRFRREAQAIARLRHEHIVSLLDYGELADQTQYLVMELLEGEDLRHVLRRERCLPVRRAIQIVVEACHALEAVHAAGLVHRDLKPENLFIARRSGGEDWCKVLDFGVAKLSLGHTTAQGSLIGTIRYMAPEQLHDSSSVDERTDVYALGAILYECLAGHAACDATTEPEMMYQIMNCDPVPLAKHRPALPGALAQVVHASLSRDRKKRPRSVGEFSARLRTALDITTGRMLDSETIPDQESRLVSHRPSALSSGTWRISLAIACAAMGGFAFGRLAAPGRNASSASIPNAKPETKVASAEKPSEARALDDVVRTLVGASEPGDPRKATVADAPASLGPPALVARPALKRATPRHDASKLQQSTPIRITGFDVANPYMD